MYMYTIYKMFGPLKDYSEAFIVYLQVISWGKKIYLKI